MNLALAYDCLYPYTIGGAEKYVRGLAERLAQRHRVTLLTRRQWPAGETMRIAPGVEVVAVCGPSPLYGTQGRRRVRPTIAYGLGLFRHLLRHRRRYDVVHVASFPFFSVLGTRAAEALGGPPCVVDWLEVWSREGWHTYLGRSGALGAAVQQLCIRLSDRPLVHAALHARRLEAAGAASPVVLTGLYQGRQDLEPSLEGPRAPLAVFAGRHIPEKHVTIIPEAVALARREIPDLEALIFGDGPERGAVESEIARLSLGGVVRSAGFAAEELLHDALRRALCLLLPSSREGYGLVIVEAAALGTPSVVLRAPESAASELISAGENGLLIDAPTPEALARALVEVCRRGTSLNRSTAAWFVRHRERLSIDSSVARLEALYDEVSAARRSRRRR